MPEPTIAIWGPPGSGKTQRLLEILTSKLESGCDLSDIAFSTFRKPLANEVKWKIQDLRDIEKMSKENYIGTTHSIAYKLLIEEGLARDVAMRSHKAEFCRKFGVPYSFTRQSEWDAVEIPERTLGDLLFGIRSFCVNSFLDYEDGWLQAPIPAELKRKIRTLLVCEFIEEWEDFKEANEIMDFADMLAEVYEEGLCPFVEALFEDEFHDKTPLQYEIYKMWAREIPEVYVAGDPLQAIYEFWNTSPMFLEAELRKARNREILHKSYRFGSKLWDYARQIPEREGLKVPELEALGRTGVHSINMRGFERLVPTFRDSDVLYLFRANYLMDPVIEILKRSGIPFVVHYGGSTKVAELYNVVCEARRQVYGTNPLTPHVIEDLSGYQALLLINSYPARCFERRKTELRREFKDKEKVNFEVTPAFKHLIQASNPFRKMLKSAPIRDDKRIQLNSIWGCRGAEQIDPDAQHVITTIHGSKGREADHVFLFDDVTRRVSKEGAPKNEARVFFVGSTRAKKHLWIVHGPLSYFTYDLPEVVSSG